MSRRGINEETRTIGVGCVQLDVEMARHHGWTEADIKLTWETIQAAVLATNQQVAKLAGMTRKCEVCECWTYPTPPCHLCEVDRRRAAGETANLNEWVCSCGRRFASYAQLEEHTNTPGPDGRPLGLLHGDMK